ncbi:hypothetical protein ACDX78_12590 [Virgibacillus oceani]
MELHYLNFSTEMHNNADEINRRIFDWGEMKKIVNQNNYKKISELKLGYLSSVMYPHASFLNLSLITEYLLISYIFKENLIKIENVSQYEDFIEEITCVFYSNKHSDNYFVSALKDWWKRYIMYIGIKYKAHFLYHFMSYVYSQYWKYHNKKNKRIPPVKESQVKRRFTEGNSVLLNFIDIANHNPYIPKKEVNILMNIANDIVNWQKDILFLEDDLAKGSTNNLVICIHHHNQIPMHQALERSIGMRDLQVDKFLKEEEKLILKNQSNEFDYKVFTSSLRKIIQGHLYWGEELLTN